MTILTMLTCLNDYHLIDDNFYIDDNFDLQLPLPSRYEQGHSQQVWRDLAAHPGWEKEVDVGVGGVGGGVGGGGGGGGGGGDGIIILL